MKISKIYLVITFLILGLFSFGQNWSLINPDYVYNYAINTVYDVSVYADSLSVENTDSTFYLNKVFQKCDTCSGDLSGALLINQPTFLQYRIQKMGHQYRFYGPRSFAILSNAGLYETWLFDTVNNITAQLVSKRLESMLWGVNDSTRYIKLSNNDTIILSKNYGIVRFDVSDGLSYYLKGVETLQGGEGYIVPKFKDYFMFEVGDVFQYYYLEGGNPSNIEEYTRLRVLSRYIYGNTISYVVEKGLTRNLLQSGSGYDTEVMHLTSYICTDTLVFIDSANHITNLYNRELYKGCSSQPLGNNTYFYRPVYVYGTIKQNFHTDNEYGEPNYAPAENFDNVIVPNTVYYTDTKKWRVGFGLSSTSYFGYYSWGATNLIGYVKNGDTTGTIYGNNFYTSVKQINSRKNVDIYPNPAKDFVVIKSEAAIEAVELYGITGKLLKQYSLEQQNYYKLKISDLEEGIYFIKVGSFLGKLVKQ